MQQTCNKRKFDLSLCNNRATTFAKSMKLKNDVRLWLDTRKPRVKTGDCPVKLVLTAQTTMRISTGIFCMPDEWDGTMPTAKHKQAKLRRMLVEVEDMVYHIEGRVTDKELRRRVENVLGIRESAEDTLTDYMRKYAELAKAEKTKQLYLHTAKVIDEYDDKVTYSTVDRRWIESFDKWMETKKGLKTNTRSIHLRNMRTVFNWGIDNEYTTNYPFRKNTIKKEETKKKALPIDTVRKLLAYKPHEDCQSHIIYKDIFMLMIYLQGINISDLMELSHEDVQGGRIEYRRNKTGILYSVKIEPEARAIINKYKGKEYLLNLSEKHRYFATAINRMLKKMGEVEIIGQGGKHKVTPLLPSDVSSNSARHTWATLAIEADMPKEIASLGLGHVIGSKTTEIYIDRKQQKKIDKCNRRVIDYILGKYTPED